MNFLKSSTPLYLCAPTLCIKMDVSNDSEYYRLMRYFDVTADALNIVSDKTYGTMLLQLINFNVEKFSGLLNKIYNSLENHTEIDEELLSSEEFSFLNCETDFEEFFISTLQFEYRYCFEYKTGIEKFREHIDEFVRCAGNNAISIFAFEGLIPFENVEINQEVVEDYKFNIEVVTNIPYSENTISKFAGNFSYNLYTFIRACAEQFKNQNVLIQKCINCGEWFITRTRHKSYICGNGKCAELTAKQRYNKKKENNPYIKAYEKSYYYHRNKTKRKNNKLEGKDFDLWHEIAVEKRDNVKNGALDEDEFINWLNELEIESNFEKFIAENRK